MLVIIDNYDSFTYNLVQYFRELKQDVQVFRNDQISPKEIERMEPEYLVISPGPCTPDEAGISVSVVNQMAGQIPILGVCLGHQSIGQAFGGKIVKAEQIMHGKTFMVYHSNGGIFKGLDNPFRAARYHSLVIERDSIPDCFEITAWTDDQEIMAVRHQELQVNGVQFHPESIATHFGHQILENFLHHSALQAH